MSSQARSWANLVGKDGKEAVAIIKKETGMTIEKNFGMNLFYPVQDWQMFQLYHQIQSSPWTIERIELELWPMHKERCHLHQLSAN